MDSPRSKIPTPATETSILWFEFLLKPNLLAAHLKKISPEAATDLISHFLSVLPDNQVNNELNSPDIEVLKLGKKNLALKILALKVAAHLRWNLDVLEKNIPLQKQVQLLSDLCSVTSGKLINLPLSLVHELAAPNAPKHLTNFPLTLYHRWVLRAQVLKGSVYRLNKTFMPM
jgi:integrator complex subunit 8